MCVCVCVCVHLRVCVCVCAHLHSEQSPEHGKEHEEPRPPGVHHWTHAHRGVDHLGGVPVEPEQDTGKCRVEWNRVRSQHYNAVVL